MTAATVMCAQARKHKKIEDEAGEVVAKARQFFGANFKDLRGGSDLEQYIAYFVYAPIIIIFVLMYVCSTIPAIKRACAFYSMRNETKLPDDLVAMVDDIGVFDYSMAKLNEYNQRRAEPLKALDLARLHNRLNNRTGFCADDTFSQATTCACIIKRLEFQLEVYDDVDNNIVRSFSKEQTTTEVHLTKINRKSLVEATNKLEGRSEKLARELSKAWNLKRKLNWLCLLSILTTSLALTQILNFIMEGGRQFVLATFENLILRICFIGVIILVGMKDMNQVLINMQVKITGAMMAPQDSRFAMDLYFIRMVIELLAMYTICYMIVTTPKHEYESVID